MIENPALLVTPLVVDIVRELGYEPENVTPEFMAWRESKLVEVATALEADTLQQLIEANAVIETLRTREHQTQEYDPYSRQLSYREGFNDGMVVARDAIIGKLGDNHPKARKLILEELGSKKPSDTLITGQSITQA